MVKETSAVRTKGPGEKNVWQFEKAITGCKCPLSGVSHKKVSVTRGEGIMGRRERKDCIGN